MKCSSKNLLEYNYQVYHTRAKRPPSQKLINEIDLLSCTIHTFMLFLDILAQRKHIQDVSLRFVKVFYAFFWYPDFFYYIFLLKMKIRIVKRKAYAKKSIILVLYRPPAVYSRACGIYFQTRINIFHTIQCNSGSPQKLGYFSHMNQFGLPYYLDQCACVLSI